MRTYLFANAHSAVPFCFDGGAERTTFTILSGLARKDVAVVQVCVLPRGGIELAVRNASSMGMAPLRGVGTVDYGCFQINSAQEHLVIRDGLFLIVAVHSSEFETTCRDLVAQTKPDLLVTCLKGSDFVLRLGAELSLPTVLRIVGPYSLDGYPDLHDNTFVLANSPVTAELAAQRYARPVDFLFGIIEHADYAVERKDPKFVTYVNPRADKGVHLFCKIAGLLPDIPLLVVEGWSQAPLESDESRALEFLGSLPNVAIRAPTSDMREIYAVTKVLLLPSRWLEAWSRVIGEAQASGIPVIASSRGCSAQSVGEGGIILDYDDPGLWANIVRMVYLDESLAWLGENARLNTHRFQSEGLLAQYAQFFSACTEGRSIELNCQAAPFKNIRADRDSGGRPRIRVEEITTRREADFAEPAYR